MRLIDADELKDRIQNGYVCLVPDPDTDKIIQMIEDSIIKVIDEASTVTSDKLEDTPKHEMISYVNKEQAKRLIYDRINELNKLNNDDYITGFIVAYQKYLFNFVLNAGLKLMAVFGMQRRKNGINNER